VIVHLCITVKLDYFLLLSFLSVSGRDIQDEPKRGHLEETSHAMITNLVTAPEKCSPKHLVFSQYQIKLVDSNTIYVSLEISGSRSLSS